MAASGTGPRLATALRQAATDLYHHSIRFVPLNLVWGLAAVVLVWVAMAGLPIPALLAMPFVALPAVAIARFAGLATRGDDIVLADAWVAIRELGLPALLGGASVTIATLVLATNVLAGFGGATLSVVGGALAVGSAWGLVALWLVTLPVLVLLADPARPGLGLVGAIQIGGTLLFAEPRRLASLSLALTAITVIGTILGAAVLTVGLAYAVAVTARVVLPLADRWIGVPPVPAAAETRGAGAR